MHEYTGTEDPMRITKDEFTSDVLDKRFQKIIGVHKDIHTNGYGFEMYENGSFPDVSFQGFSISFGISA